MVILYLYTGTELWTQHLFYLQYGFALLGGREGDGCIKVSYNRGQQMSQSQEETARLQEETVGLHQQLAEMQDESKQRKEETSQLREELAVAKKDLELHKSIMIELLDKWEVFSSGDTKDKQNVQGTLGQIALVFTRICTYCTTMSRWNIMYRYLCNFKALHYIHPL